MSRRKNTNKYLVWLIGAAVVVLTTLFFILNHFFFHIDGLPDLNELLGIPQPLTESISDGEIQVHYISVGQGDCELILTSDKTVLIDGGETDKSGVVYNYLKALGIDDVDYVICTHPHSDHIGALPNLFEYVSVGKIIMPYIHESMIPTTESYGKLLRAADAKNIPVSYAEKGSSFELDDECELTIIAPVGKEYDSLNNYSVVCRLRHYENSFLFTGDIEEEALQDILSEGADVSADVIKVPHHGSATSGSYVFLKAVRPEYAVFCVGADNNFGHPDTEIYNRYKEFDCKRLRTDLDGTVIFTSSENNLSYITEFEIKKKGGQSNADM